MITFQGEKFLREQLESILSQLAATDEVIIADDGSTDATISLIQNFSDARIHLIQCESHLGPIYNLERALLQAKGDLIFLADQDDVWLPQKVSVCKQELQDSILVLHNAYFYTQEKNGNWKCGTTIFEKRKPVHGIFKNWLRNSFTGCCIAFRRELLLRALPFPKSLPMHDQWLGLIAEKSKKVRFVNEPLLCYRRHAESATDLLNHKKANFFNRLRWRWNLLRIFLQRFSN